MDQFRCPKCNSLDYTLFKDSRTFGFSSDARIFTCRCGKQLFGKQIDDAEAAQKTLETPDSNREQLVIEQLHIRANTRNEEERQHREELLKKRHDQQEAELRRQKEWTEAHNATLSAEPEECAWHACTNISRDTSKYCSRNCSNKNARFRHKHKGKKAA